MCTPRKRRTNQTPPTKNQPQGKFPHGRGSTSITLKNRVVAVVLQGQRVRLRGRNAGGKCENNEKRSENTAHDHLPLLRTHRVWE